MDDGVVRNKHLIQLNVQKILPLYYTRMPYDFYDSYDADSELAESSSHSTTPFGRCIRGGLA